MDPMDKTPKQIVKELDQYIIGQTDAKKAVAVALRNRYRRMQLSPEMQEDITPKNLLMIGPTGVGKTEIARRLAKIVHAPFVKVEATKFTEVGYVGGDVESMVRDLVENAVQEEKARQFSLVKDEAIRNANKELARLFVPAKSKEEQQKDQQGEMKELLSMWNDIKIGKMPSNMPNQNKSTEKVSDEVKQQRKSTFEKLEQGFLDDQEVSIQMNDPKQEMSENNNMLGQMGIDLNDTLGNILPKKMITRKMPVHEARKILIQQESEKLVNDVDIYHVAINRAENAGIIFIDEIDKIAHSANSNNQSKGEVSREGVQRDILPIVEGAKIKTKYGLVDTSHILFIGSGAFAETKPSDLIAELQGRFPIRVELNALTTSDFVKILTEPNNALIKQYIALIGTDNIKVTFTIEAIKKISEIAFDVNRDTENIGARRLHTILEKLLEDLLYEGPDMEMGNITITEQYVEDKVGNLAKDHNLSQFIL